MDRQNKLKDSLLSFLTNLFDLMVVNWLWLVCSLPIITVGPATCGLYCVTLKLARGEPVNCFRDFFRGFRQNSKPGVLLGLGAVVLLIVAATDVWFAWHQTGWLQTLYYGIAVILAVIWLVWISYTFALQAMFDAPLKVHILNAFQLAVIAPGKTLRIWLTLLVPVLAALILPPVALQMLGFLYLVAGISAPVYFASNIQRSVFDYVSSKPAKDSPPAAEG